MIRTIYLSSLFCCACSLAVLGLASLWQDVGWRGAIGEHHRAGLVLEDGAFTLWHTFHTSRRFHRRYERFRMGWLGDIRYRVRQRGGRWRSRTLSGPVWPIVTLLLVHPAIALIRGPLRRRRRQARDECVECGYSLVGNLSGRCPECGTSAVAGFTDRSD